MSDTRNTDPAIVHVRYEGTPDDTFDRRYYVDHHLPLARAAYTQYGLESIAAFFPAVDQPGTVAICEFRYADEAAIDIAFGSTEADGVRAEIAQFTDLKAIRSRALPLDDDREAADADPTILFVTYRGTSETRFDRSYYVEKHLPLVAQAWAQYGLERVAAFFPAVEEAGTIAICECRFRDVEAVTAAFASPEAPAVMADVPVFTDAAPIQTKIVGFAHRGKV
jgi:uncharacterized protein (TIGR02118 family)